MGRQVDWADMQVSPVSRLMTLIFMIIVFLVLDILMQVSRFSHPEKNFVIDLIHGKPHAVSAILSWPSASGSQTGCRKVAERRCQLLSCSRF